MRIIKALAFAGLAAASFVTWAAQPVIDLSKGAKPTPGVYGEVKVGKRKPPLVDPKPKTIVIYTHPVKEPEPVYMHVPPEQAQNWQKYCLYYRVCQRPTYFVKSREYEPGYVPSKRVKAARAAATAAIQQKHDSSRNGSGTGMGDGTGRKNKGNGIAGNGKGGGGGRGNGSGGGRGRHKNKSKNNGSGTGTGDGTGRN